VRVGFEFFADVGFGERDGLEEAAALRVDNDIGLAGLERGEVGVGTGDGIETDLNRGQKRQREKDAENPEDRPGARRPRLRAT
jgi:hypothetical protein